MLREFKYLDRQIVVDFLSSIEGGLATASKASLSKKGGKLGVKANVPTIFEVEGERGSKEISIEESRTIEDAALFERLYNALAEQKMIEKVDGLKEDSLKNMRQGKVLEIHGTIEVPFFEVLLDVFTQIIPLMSYSTSGGLDQKGIDALKMFNTMSLMSALNVRIIPSQTSEANFVLTLSRDKLRVKKQELSDECSSLCRVRRILKKDETFDMLRLPVKINKTIMGNLLQSFEKMPSDVSDILGRKPAIDDLQIRSPAIILTPIAIYQ